jgi:DNA (cytosine-5)-methyltransferase 1
MDIGFALAGFTPVWANDFDINAMETHGRIFKRLRDELPHLSTGSWQEVTGSILDVIGQGDLPSKGAADLVIGGPPCQGFSVAGRMDPTDRRSEHVFHFFEVVEHVSPIAFVMENVKALYENRRWTPIREALLDRAHTLGYETKMMCLNASHFGSPQARERMILIGIRGGNPLEPVTTSIEDPPTVREALSQLPRIGELGNCGLCTAKITPALAPVMRKSPFAGMLFNGAGRPLDLDSPSLTLPASMGGNKTPIIDQESLDSGAIPWVVGYHERLTAGRPPAKKIPKRLRRLSVEEAAALQTFPLGTEWAGSQSSQFRQIGNAVPPRLALAVAESVKAALGLN